MPADSGSPPKPSRTPNIMFWGTYDLSKPRTRILLEGLKENGAKVIECHAPVWEKVTDKATMKKGLALLRAAHLISSYPRLIIRFLRTPTPDLVFVGYLGQLDVLVLYPFARWRGIPVVWDQFISVYDTVVNDRALCGRHHPIALGLYAWEWLACRAAARVLMDTRAHAAFISETFHLAKGRVEAVWVGAEPETFPRSSVPSERPSRLQVLFYGQFIPLHGIDVIVEAAHLLKQEPIDFTLIGTGQCAPAIRAQLRSKPLDNLKWINWSSYEQLATHIHAAQVCLGIFGVTGKASRVVPNKVFQVLSAGRPLITRDSPAMRELLSAEEAAITLIPPGNARALADALLQFRKLRSPIATSSSQLLAAIAPRAIGQAALRVFQRLLSG